MFLSKPDFKKFTGPSGKCPWITDDDGTVVADSQPIIDYLTKKFNIHMLDATPQDEAVIRAMRALLEDNFYFVLMTEKNVFGTLKELMDMYPRLVPKMVPNFVQNMIIRKYKSCGAKTAKAQGIGRHTRSFNTFSFFQL
jgi:hypothetical protein